MVIYNSTCLWSKFKGGEWTVPQPSIMVIYNSTCLWSKFKGGEWTVPHLSIMVIHKGTWSKLIQWIMVILSGDNLTYKLQKEAYFLFVINLATRSKKIDRNCGTIRSGVKADRILSFYRVIEYFLCQLKLNTHFHSYLYDPRARHYFWQSYAIMYNVIWANQKTESFEYHRLSSLARFDITSFPGILLGIGHHFKFCWYINSLRMLTSRSSCRWRRPASPFSTWVWTSSAPSPSHRSPRSSRTNPLYTPFCEFLIVN